MRIAFGLEVSCITFVHISVKYLYEANMTDITGQIVSYYIGCDLDQHSKETSGVMIQHPTFNSRTQSS